MITNYLSPIGFTAHIARLPSVEFFTQRAVIPGLSIQQVEQPTPLHRIYSTGDRLDYSDLDLSFIVDENMNNYLEMLAWMEGIGSPNTSDEYKNLEKSEDGVTSDITLTINNSSKNPNFQVTFFNCFPTSLSPVQLDVTQTDIQYPECSVTFRYDTFKIEKIG